ncbi:FtsK/SpoIIIE domain-containing protein [Actinomyces wuliandei]|uniref:FtsK/SpoIIIE domain-containing protein n=1 Tax=Actinomyces wuliandei TaxID=2057743 RepID=UPI000FDA1C69|nr:FtsK/SpoIIIE domain-containing protein [Actinomyces wuliandei]
MSPRQTTLPQTTAATASHEHGEPGQRHLPPAGRAARSALTSPWHLAVLTGPDRGLVVPVEGYMVLGRGEVLSDPLVSRRHLSLRVRPGGVDAHDVGSANGSWHRRPRGPWRPLHGHSRLREGSRLYLGGSVLELRHRPTSLLVPAPPRPQAGTSRRALATALICLLPLAALALLPTHSEQAPGTFRLLAAVPVMTMVAIRLASASQGRAARQRTSNHPAPARWGRPRDRPGWSRQRPDPSTMLLAVAARSFDSHPPNADACTQPPADHEGEQRAWTGEARRGQILSLDNGDRLALTGDHAQDTLRWWCTQVLARQQAQLLLTDTGARLQWGPASRPREAMIMVCPHSSLPPQALNVTAGSPTAPTCSRTWWETVCALGTVTCQTSGPGGSGGRASGVPEQVVLTELLDDLDPAGVSESWQRQERLTATGQEAPRLEAVLGIGSDGPVRADLVAHGPHALLAGTTGSGKSELLVSWLLQLALGTSPARLTLVLVDYKGGAAFGLLASLPHTAGVLTDLDPSGTQRALSSLQAEVRRRERLLSSHAAKDILSLPSQVRVPHLVIAIDEFATLAASHTDILDTLVRLAAQGRSLGIHLILSTQRPQGAVSPAIRTNTALRACLRVLDAADSRDVLGHEGAARLPHHPGRVLIHGTDAPDTGALQAPWCGTEEQVESLVGLVTAAAQGHEAAWRPWAAPLPARVDRDQALSLASSRSYQRDTSTQALERALTILLGLTDLPEDQSLGLWYWDSQRPLLVLGSPGSGRTTTVLSAAAAALEASSPVHLCLSRSPRLQPPRTAALPSEAARQPWPAVEPATDGLGTVVGVEDPRRLARLWSLATSGSLAGSLLCLDDVDALVPAVDEALGPGEGHSLLETLVRTAPGTGTRLLLTAPLAAASSRWGCAIGLRLVLGAHRRDQAAQACLPRTVVTGSGPGRGVILDGSDTTACQVILPPSTVSRRPRARPRQRRPDRAGPAVLRLEPLPRLVPAGSVAPGTWAVGGDDASPVPVPRGTSVLVVGPPGSGRTATLAALEHALTGPVHVYDDLDLAPRETLSGAEAVLGSGGTVLASAATDRAASTYRGVLAALRERAAVVVLWPGIGPGHQVAGVPLRPATDPRALSLPGRGVLVHRGTATPLQVVAPLPGEKPSTSASKQRSRPDAPALHMVQT